MGAAGPTLGVGGGSGRAGIATFRLAGPGTGDACGCEGDGGRGIAPAAPSGGRNGRKEGVGLSLSPGDGCAGAAGETGSGAAWAGAGGVRAAGRTGGAKGSPGAASRLGGRRGACTAAAGAGGRWILGGSLALTDGSSGSGGAIGAAGAVASSEAAELVGKVAARSPGS